MRVLSTAILATLLASCGGGSSTGPGPDSDGVATVSVSPPSSSVAVGGSVQLTATPKDAGGATLTGRAITWSSQASAVATVSGSGLVTAVAAGSTTITATSEGRHGQATITVTGGGPAAVATVTISAVSTSLVPAQTAALTATLKDAGGNTLTGRSIAWQSSNQTVATVNGTGTVTAVAPGSATITATSEGKSGTAQITVVPRPVNSVTLSGGAASITVGATTTFTVTLRDVDNAELTGRDVTWISSNAAVASVSATGVVTGVSAGGPVTITATSEGKSGTAAITVTASFAWVQISVNDMSTCGLTTAGKAYCWGNNQYGEVGDGSTTRRTVPTPVAGGHTFAVIAAGKWHTCALDTAGQPWCWGNNEQRQLGDFGANRPTPVAIATALRFTKLVAGFGWTCGLTGAGAAWCWGYGSEGQLGNSDVGANSAVPVEVSGGHIFLKLAAGSHHSCGIDDAKNVWCWGDGVQVELGDGTHIKQKSPVLVPGLIGVADISLGEYHTCAVTTGGAAWCWGMNIDNRSGGSGSVQLPRQVPGSYQAIGIGETHSCALGVDGKVYCWGRNNWGQFGDNSASSNQRGTPGVFSSGVSLVSLTSGWNHLCGLTATGEAWCWGQNPGALGDGSATSRFVPTKVLAPAT